MNKKIELAPSAKLQKIAVCETKSGISILKHLGEGYGNQFFRPNEKYKINGEEFSVPEAKHQFQFSGKVNSIQKRIEKTFLVGYKNTETGATISIEEYEGKKVELSSKKVIDPDDYECLIWATLVDRQAYDLFVKTYEQVRETEVSWQDFELEYFQIAHSDYEEIVPLWQIGKPVDDPMCQYTPDSTKWFMEIASELGFENVGNVDYSNTKGFKYSFSSNSGLEYVKMNGSYLYGSSTKEWQFWQKTDTYQNCVQQLNADKAKIRAKIMQQKRLLDESNFTANERAEVLSTLKIILSHLSDVSSKEKTRDSLSSAKNKLSALIGKI